MKTTSANPFLHELLDRDSLPRYDLIAPEHVAPAIDQLLANARIMLDTVTHADTPVSWDAVMEPLTDATERLDRAWSAVHHMSGVLERCAEQPAGGRHRVLDRARPTPRAF